MVCHCLIICCGQGLVASYCFITFATKTKFHSPKRAFRAILSFAVVWGWWSAIVLSFAVVRGWWPAIVLSHLPPKTNFIVQNERFARGFFEISQTKLPKRTFRARLPRNFTEQASKTSVSCEASSKFHRPSFQNERFVRGFLKISPNKLPKQAFRARLPRNFIEQASKTSASCEASSKFHRTSFQNERFVRRTKLPKRTFRARLPRNYTEQASKTNVSCEASSKFHRTKLPKRRFRVMLPTISIENLRFATVSCHRPTESYERVHPAKAKCAYRYNGVQSKISKCTFYYSGARKNV